jgi:hypothetical protein
VQQPAARSEAVTLLSAFVLGPLPPDEFLGNDGEEPFDEDVFRARLEAKMVARIGVMGKRLNAGLQYMSHSQQKPTATVGPGQTEASTAILSANAAEMVKRISVRSGDSLP